MSDEQDRLDVKTLAREAREQIPAETAFTDADSQVVIAHKDFLLSLSPLIVKRFYDSLFGNAATAAVFKEGERPRREQTLVDWWKHTVEGPHDDDYFAWMAMVGLVHVVRGVNTAMVLAMAEYIGQTVAEQAQTQLSPDDCADLLASYRRLSSMVTAVIGYSYDVYLSSEEALLDVAGMPTALLHRLRDKQVKESLSEARAQLGRPRQN
ncbi:MAG: protoglobin domain-containing protein [Pseudoclavibacter sp.]